MQACIEDVILPLVEPTSLPLRESASAASIDTTPTWTFRVARPPSENRNQLAQELRGVPKAALRHVFGKIMGTRLWQLNRAIAEAAPASAKPAPVAAIQVAPIPAAIIPDVEIRDGMLTYLCKEIAATLRERKRVAKSIVLTVQFSNGESANLRQSLPQPANDSAALEAAARLALRRMRSTASVGLKLDVTATTAPCDSAPIADPAAAHAPLRSVA